MARVTTNGYELDFETIALCAPWIENPETVLFHHGLGSRRDTWAEWLPALIDRYRIVRFDMRAHGRSGDSNIVPSFEQLCADALAVAEAAGIDRFHFVGESIGGTVAIALALQAPERIITATISNAAFKGQAITATEDFDDAIRADGMVGWSRTMMPRRFPHGGLSTEAWRWYEAQQAGIPSEFLKANVNLLIGVDFTPDLDRVTQPILLLQGDSSPFISVETMAELHRRLPNAQLNVFANAGHGLPFSHGRSCSAVLRAFLDAQPPAHNLSNEGEKL